MKIKIIFFFLFLYQLSTAQVLRRAEYFVDTAPDNGKGITIPILNDKDSIDISEVIVNTTGLSLGSHIVYVRVLGSNGLWSIVRSAGFLVGGAASIADSTLFPFRKNYKIIKAEYFVDTAPDNGKGITIPILNDKDSIDIAEVIVNTTSLSLGSHIVYVRVLGSNGLWSIVRSAGFLVGGAASIADSTLFPFRKNFKINKAEYFVDKDPGNGLGINIPITAPADSIAISEVIVNTTGLKEGSHIIYLRTLSANGLWSILNSAAFIIKPQIKADSTLLNRPSVLVAGEYFVGNQDPGLGKATALKNLPTAAESWDAGSFIETDNLSTDTSRITVRFKNSQGLWSFGEVFEFIICLNPPKAPSATGTTICNGSGVTDLKATGIPIKTYQWFSSSWGGLPLANSKDSIYNTGTLNRSTNYWVAQKGTDCGSSRTKVAVEVVQQIPTPTSANVSRCGPGRVVLKASGAPLGGTYRWYATNTSTTWLKEDSIFVTDSLTTSRNYFVSAITKGATCVSALRRNVSAIIKTCITQTITFPFVNDLIFGVDDFALLKATASSGLKVQYELISGLARLSNDTVYPTSIGEVTIRATQPGDANFEEAPSVIKRFIILGIGTTVLIDYAKPVCTGDALKLTALSTTPIPNGKYQWTGPNGFTSSEINPVRNNIALADSGKYTLIVYSTSDTLSASVNVPVLKKTTNVSLYAVLTSKCDKEVKVFAGGDSIVSFQWFYNAKKLIGYTSTTYTPNFTGVYSVTGFNAEGCPTSSTPIYVDVNPDSIPVITRIKNPDRIRSTPSVNYQWFVNNYFIVGSNSREIPLIFNGTYNVKVSDKNNCEKFSYDFFVNDENLYTISRASIIGNTINLEDYNSKIVEAVPVPANNSTKISWASPERGALKLKVFSAAGVEHALYHLDKSTEKFTYEFDTSTWKDGLYLLNITCGEKSIVGKITVVH